MAIALKGDFISFSFNGYRSEDLGIVRVSDGSRYSENLIPTSQDKTVQVPGGDGFYYFGSDNTQRTFNINIAFGELTEEQFRKLRQVFGTKELGKLIFDERPYKYYMVKAGEPQLKYICFTVKNSDGTNSRIYKGEGTITFTAYYPYAKSVYKYLNEYSNTNKDEWSASSRMIAAEDNTFSVEGNSSPYSLRVYNAGDLEADFILKLNFGTVGDISLIKKDSKENTVAILQLSSFSAKGSDVRCQINTKTNLIEGIDSNGKPTGNLYNEYIIGGDFFKIPAMSSSDEFWKIKFSCDGVPSKKDLVYDYIYY